jgi:hypothetical protein
MNNQLQNIIALLERTPRALDSFLRDLPDSLTHRNEGADSWSVFDVIGHLIHGERTDWIPRTQRLLEFGEEKPFSKFDRFAQERESEGKTLPELLDIFAAQRARSLDTLRGLNLTAADLERRGLHPALGVVTLSNLLSTWAAHDLTHLHQISRVMAHQFRPAVGPWTVYLGVMQCAGHSE